MVFCLMKRRPPRPTRTYTLFPDPTLFRSAMPEPLASRLPRYPTVPAVLIGWLGRDQSYAGFGLGEALLFDAIKTIAEAPIGAHAIFADAIDEKAAAFYAAFRFTALIDRSEEHTSELQSLMRISYAVFCLKIKRIRHKLN